MMGRQQTLVRIALASILLAVVSHTRADPDLWGHVLFGGDIVRDLRVPDADTYAFTSDRAWINHEWLAECAMFLAFTIGGGPGLIALKMLVVLLALAFIWDGLRRQQVDAGARDLLIALAVVGTFPQAAHVRPQIFSIVAFAALLWTLAGGRSLRRIWLVPLVFAAWVNLHGGWIVGGGVLALWWVLTLPAGASRAEKQVLFFVGAASLVATLANPYGWRMWQFLATTVGFGRPEITDWQPLYRLGAGYLALWAILALVTVTGIARAVRSGQWELRRLGVVVALGLASLQVGRLVGFFAIALVLLQGPDLAAMMRARRADPSSAPSRRGRVATVAAMTIVAALIAGAAATSAGNVSCVRLGVGGADPGVVPLVREREWRGRLAVWFDWGEYAIWHFRPALQVSIDGRRETVYSDEVLQKHLRFYYVPSSRDAFLDDIRPDYIWLPVDLPVVASLRDDGWRPLYESSRSVWLARPDAGADGEATSVRAESGRCFPGP